MSQVLSVDLRNCYGIGSLKADFDFKHNRATVLYAPNGAMKTSFARTFKDIIEGAATSDRIFPDRENVRVVNFGDAGSVDPSTIVVIEPFNSSYESKGLSKLLVNEALRKEYDEIHGAVSKSLGSLIDSLSKTSGLKKGDLANVFVSDTTISKTDTYTAFARLERQVSELEEPLFDLKYKDVFNDKILAVLEDEEIKKKIEDYSRKYEELLTKSRFFRAGKFNHYNASTVAKILKDNGWFAGGHTVTLRNQDSFVEIDSEEALVGVIQDELNSILNDAELKKAFNELDKVLNKNAELREYRDFLSKNSAVIAELADIKAFKERLWISYLCAHKDEYRALIAEYDDARKELDRIRAVARDEASRWSEVISIFNERFSVPFRVYVDNQEDVILQSVAPALGFSYYDAASNSEKKVSNDVLDRALSQGERRAKYLLNVIFEMEGRRSDSSALFIIGDIADSFDYKNKYAIIEYLKDISEHASFYQLILTHNYDFFRTVVSRLELHQPNRLYASKSDNEITIVPTPKEQNPFLQWKKDLSNPVNVIACVPFIRNIAEYCGNAGCFEALTLALHWKPETPQLTFGDISTHFGEVITDGSAEISAKSKVYVDTLFECCETLCGSPIEDFSLEKKIVLAIGSRLLAERFMVAKIADDNWVSTIRSSQTGKLSKKFMEQFGNTPEYKDARKIIRRVNLITPENVHVNSFMYEPILDLSPSALRDLYRNVKSALV
jgi:hypothetical protein